MKKIFALLGILLTVAFFISNSLAEELSQDEYKRLREKIEKVKTPEALLKGNVILEGEIDLSGAKVNIFESWFKYDHDWTKEKLNRCFSPTTMTETDKDGNFKISLKSDLAGTTIPIIFTAKGYMPHVKFISLEKKEHYRIEQTQLKRMENPEFAIIAGIAFDEEPNFDLRVSNIKLLENVVINIIGKENTYRTRTDKKGFYVLSIPEGEYVITFGQENSFYDNKGGFLPLEESFTTQLGWQKMKEQDKGKINLHKGETVVVNYKASEMAW